MNCSGGKENLTFGLIEYYASSNAKCVSSHLEWNGKPEIFNWNVIWYVCVVYRKWMIPWRIFNQLGTICVLYIEKLR